MVWQRSWHPITVFYLKAIIWNLIRIFVAIGPIPRTYEMSTVIVQPLYIFVYFYRLLVTAFNEKHKTIYPIMFQPLVVVILSYRQIFYTPCQCHQLIYLRLFCVNDKKSWKAISQNIFMRNLAKLRQEKFVRLVKLQFVGDFWPFTFYQSLMKLTPVEYLLHP